MLSNLALIVHPANVLNVFRSLSFSTSTRMNVPACIRRRVFVSELDCIRLHVRVMNPSGTCVQHLDRRPGRPAPAQDCLRIFDPVTSTNPGVKRCLSKLFLSIAVAKMSLTLLAVGNFQVTNLFASIMSWIHK